jgi:putative FmdB family regulatory protein
MPTYEYACQACGHQFDRFESITAKPNKACEKCGRKKAERRISGGGGFLFKGTGFYVTDYKKSGGSAAKSCESGECKPAPVKADAGHACSGACAHASAPAKKAPKSGAA